MIKQIISFAVRHRILGICILCLISIGFLSARPRGTEEPENSEKKVTKVFLLHADIAKANEKLLPGVQVLVGNVKFRHDSMYMYCDSAHVYEKTNSFEAFNNVRMEQGDTLFIYGDYLFYDGQSMIAMLRNNVRMINRNTTLTTDSLNYDRVQNYGYYFEGGSLEDEKNVLTSFWGEYSPETKIAVFNIDVELNNDQMTMLSDTLEYSTETKIASIWGSSNIYNGKNHIYSELGFYNTNLEQAELLNRSVLTNEGKSLVGDSVFYDKKKGYGEAFKNVIMNDTVQKSVLTGDYCFYNELTDYAFATEKAVAIDYSQGDSLYLHADTLKLITYNNKTDSVYRDMLAFRKVRVFRQDVQAICDSLSFSTRDTCLRMFYEPVLWHGPQQILGEHIDIYMNDSTIDWAHIYNQSLSVEHVDSTFFNQVSGKEMKAYFNGNGDIRKVSVIGNVLSVYYPLDEDSTAMVMNTAESSQLDLYMENRLLERMVMSPASNGVTYPMDQIPDGKSRLASFVWLQDLRPKDKYDIFIWKGKKEDDKLKDVETREIKLPTRIIKEDE